MDIIWQTRPNSPLAELGWDLIDTGFGPAVAVRSLSGLCGLGFCGENDPHRCLGDLTRRWPHDRLSRDPSAAELARCALQGTGLLHVMGTPFQQSIWQQLCLIRSGETVSYGELAARAAAPRAVRAAATAVGQNPISLIIPCHRVISKTGALGGYHWGAACKRAMLHAEAP